MRNKTRTADRKKPSVFYVLYGCFMILAVTAILLGTAALCGYFAEYEAALPKYAAQSVLEDWFSPVDYGAVYDLGGITLPAFATKEDFVSFMEETYGIYGFSLDETASADPDIRYYQLSKEQVPIATVLLKKSDELTPHGLAKWELDTVRAEIQGAKTLLVEVISGSTLRIADCPVSEDYITERGIPTDTCSHMPDGVSGITYDRYEIHGLLAQPELSVTDKNGLPGGFTYNASAQLWTEQPQSDPEIEIAQSQRCIEAAEYYARYLTRDATLSDLTRFFDETSEAYRLVKTSDTRWYSDHLGYEFANETIGAFYSYDDHTFSCRYTCTHNIRFRDDDIRPFDLDLTFYYRYIDDGYYIYDLITNT